ncbi:NADPH-dependent ferric siderophore reductase, contains FAD-binding and SIP domains [Blastococcus aurantiacus]|uniref:NADPH-dependent ferric siderophore reductase, contains FAD-binding and SIP domains n=1 Tax=Blastococcus aurantiacus TaxID=1550231 RepID=A0A1G7J2L9_9ACTN|nr:siderophore-interacting protein [Blastococcus aurantiacus]SDF19242.1 NADPH-dependent ferric siderophore reductase, contains FAD-binding and SIP domains [Blastococcus aurantiacus]
MTVQTVQVPVYRPFGAQVLRLRRLSPSFLRVTFTGADLDEFGSNGFDQRIKVMLPLPGRGIDDCPTDPDWYGAWRALPAERRMPIRTYTIRAVRSEQREVDVDFVLHGATGPASAWAESAVIGDEVVLIGPNARFPGPTGGFEWHPPVDASCLLIAGDETAVPAICTIVESLPAGQRARVLLEIPEPGDVLDVAVPPGVEVTWLPRSRGAGVPAPRGSLLTAAVVEATAELADLLAPSPVAALEDIDVDSGILWEVPAEAGSAPGSSGVYAWLAGEAGVVKGLRRHLVQELGVDRRSVAFMGYWREGRESD